jgi:uncharacterized protein YbjQ (UPF0145 family)
MKDKHNIIEPEISTLSLVGYLLGSLPLIGLSFVDVMCSDNSIFEDIVAIIMAIIIACGITGPIVAWLFNIPHKIKWNKNLVQCRTCNSHFKYGDIQQNMLHISGYLRCRSCLEKSINNIIISTTHNVEQENIESNLGLISTECILGTSIFSEFQSGIDDFFGSRVSIFEDKVSDARNIAIDKLKLLALEKGADHIIGLITDYPVYSDNKIGVVVSGTAIKVK